ncbi:universal stress protein [Janthinobacterium agaricidamnosum]|uniref:Universal stress family protein n=1 Tax=Janthinobacterium agaricidamnosum NBRC 102515 = DSM 9628 TaxID=1349767 RepID=W0VAL3_9BURK|nr:universal stress protein [Janthinobacterium agaricidamnosum]CDG84312.1 universal stress family protein [Janthinobacterium agaricidamnosum NBRC 102515 = DSM 9628]
MSYKNVLVHLDESERSLERSAIAAGIAHACGGHLLGVALTGVSRLLYQNGLGEGEDPNLELHLDLLRQRASRALAGFGERAAATGLLSFEQRVVDDEAGGGISSLARYADLVVIGQFNPQQPSRSVMSDFPGHVLLHAGRPVLIVPYAAPAADLAPVHAARNILVSWNASKEASRAVSAALPLLQRAGAVHVTVIDPQHHAHEHGEQPGADIVRYLQRHGVASRLTLHQVARRRGDVGDILLSLAADVAADVMVMGAYGHSRLRETILGGATHTVLQKMTIPVLMSH